MIDSYTKQKQYELLKLPEVAELFRVSESTVRRLVDRRMLPFFKVARSLRFARADIDEFLTNGRIESIK